VDTRVTVAELLPKVANGSGTPAGPAPIAAAPLRESNAVRGAALHRIVHENHLAPTAGTHLGVYEVTAQIGETSWVTLRVGDPRTGSINLSPACALMLPVVRHTRNGKGDSVAPVHLMARRVTLHHARLASVLPAARPFAPIEAD
jgi:hypothetical protein